MEKMIGEGGMAIVYLAEDGYLHRKVAVKVLRSQFSGDEEFVRRFRREAQAAASLSHPNVVAIYDVGELDDTYYIVMEYVDGRTLKDVIKQDGPLPIPTAARIAAQICDALEHAHQNKIVHRDIKSQNILLTRTGRVKVADFGIARAVATSTLVNTGTIIGSAHYFSPEQARGGFVTEKSDLYALGVVLYEMVTGAVPFDGDSPISVAVKHLQEKARPPRQLVPHIPARLEAIILRAMEKDPGRRYQSAGEMLNDLNAALHELSEGRGGGVDVSRTMVLDRTRPSREIATAGDRPEEGAGEGAGTGAPARRRRIPTWAVVTITALVLFAVGIKAAADWINVPIIQVPPVEGISLPDAERTLRAAQLDYKVVASMPSSQVPANHVISQKPEAGESVRAGRRIELTLSMGPDLVKDGVPPVEGKHIREAQILLEGAGLTVRMTETYNADVPAEYVISQNPRAGTRVEKGTEVILVVSKGPQVQEFVLPDFYGDHIDDVRQRLADLGLKEGTLTQVASDKQPGIVISQDPQAGTTVKTGDKVNFQVAQGYNLPKHRSRVTIVVPQNAPAQSEIRVVVIDARGGSGRTAYEDIHRPGDNFDITVDWIGQQARLVVYMNGSVLGEQILKP